MKKITFLAFFLLAAAVLSAQVVENKVVAKHGNTKVLIETTMGPIVVELYEETPQHRENFIKLAEEGVYDGLLFHRVIEKFMIQAGDPKSREAEPGMLLGDGTLGYTIPAEIAPHLFHRRGALCAARQGDEVNPMRESSASQFYIVQGTTFDEKMLKSIGERFHKTYTTEQAKVYATEGGAPHLDGDYTVFGQVVEGMEVVDAIAGVPCDKNNRPKEDVRIIGIKIIDK